MKRKQMFFVLVMFTGLFCAIGMWSGTDAASGEEGHMVNLASGKSYTIDMPYPVDAHFGPQEEVYADDGTILTNGQYGGTQFNNGFFAGFLRQDSRTITIDLEEQATVQSLSLNILQDLDVGIQFPTDVTYSLSNNGVAWEEVGSVSNKKMTTQTGPLTQMYTLADINKVARYVRAEIPVATWLFMDEFEVLGTEGHSGEAIIPSRKGPKENRGYPTPGKDQVGGIHNQVLIYTGEWQYEPADWISFTKHDFKPYVTYVDEEMNAVDYMFDSFLFLPYARQLDGTNFNAITGDPTNMSHWEQYMDRLFADGLEFSALNEAVGEAKAELPNRNYEASVVVAIPIPRYDQSDFGDILGTGESMNLNVSEIGEEAAFENNKKVIQWFVDRIYERWEEANYEHIDLKGFYWYPESATRSTRELDDDLIRWTGEYVRSQGAVFQWIPYYFARGWQDWEELGFDSAVMQPNYFFHGNATIDRLDAIANAAYENGMGVEIELDDNVLSDEFMRQRYYDYLDKGKEHGFMNQSYQVFYQQVKTLLQAAHSSEEDVREVYDQTYKYLKGNY